MEIGVHNLCDVARIEGADWADPGAYQMDHQTRALEVTVVKSLQRLHSERNPTFSKDMSRPVDMKPWKSQKLLITVTRGDRSLSQENESSIADV
jgi:hypothetical protein